MINRICPCLVWFGLSGEAKPKPKKGYKPYQQFQQEEFMHQLENEAKKSKINANQALKEQIPIEQQLQHQLNLSQKPTAGTIERKKSDKRENETQAQQKVQQTNNNQNNQVKTIEQEKSYGFSNLGQLQINIPQYGVNYQLLKQKSHNVAQLLDVSQNCTEVSVNPGLKAHQSKLNINKSRFRVWRTSTQNSYVIQYEIPCSYSYYSEIINKKVQPKDNSKLIKQFKLIQTIHPNLSLRYVCFNKIGMLEPRDFTYLKYTNISTTNPSGHWQLCISKQPQKQPNTNNATKSGKLYTVSYIIEEHKPETNPGIRIKVRSYINLQINVTVEKVWEKILSETKNYVGDIWDDAANNYSEQLV